MNFPISATVTKSNANFPTATLLKIDGNSGEIPNRFQANLFADDAEKNPTVLLTQPNVAMTQPQWAEWKDQDDEEYILTCVANNLGLEISFAVAAKKKAPAAKRRKKSR